IIPGWETLPITLLCAGGVILIGGSLSAITAQHEMETIKSRMEKEQMKAMPGQSTPAAFIKRLTDCQAQNNINVINDWMDKIEAAIDDFCKINNA
ncbi:MAG: hypothetical protein LUI87_02740, partial [Lachnospiraceae bacterium]|nr:hypothetical protein [Lachnospiraceae bacterium]